MRKLLTIAAICAAAFLAVAPNASAAPGPVGHGQVSVQSDGYLHLYFDYNLRNQCGAWAGNATDLGQCTFREASLWNNGDCSDGHPDVLVYADTNQASAAHRGVYCGVAINDLHNYIFDIGTGTGAGDSLFHNIGSLKWVKLPR
jgi:hypothetical protein